MKNSWIGILFIAMGVMFLLDSMGVMEFGVIIKKFWPVVFILVGVAILLKRKRT
ncbi:MAG: hypothetical protein HY961_21845 [Ignavibacteriae bacterium]|nr:hypothetical protein [Ignavibacteriota bacterium]